MQLTLSPTTRAFDVIDRSLKMHCMHFCLKQNNNQLIGLILNDLKWSVSEVVLIEINKNLFLMGPLR